MELQNKNQEEALVFESRKTMKVIKLLLAIVAVATGIVVASPVIAPFIAMVFGGISYS